MDRLTISTCGFFPQALDFGELAPGASVMGPAKYLERFWFVGHGRKWRESHGVCVRTENGGIWREEWMSTRTPECMSTRMDEQDQMASGIQRKWPRR